MLRTSKQRSKLTSYKQAGPQTCWCPQNATNLAPLQTDIFKSFRPRTELVNILGKRVPKIQRVFEEILW